MKLETELATLYWELVANMLRQQKVAEHTIVKFGHYYKAGFVLGHAAGVHSDDEDTVELEPAVGFSTGAETVDVEVVEGDDWAGG